MSRRRMRRSPGPRTPTNRILLNVHKWCGLTGAVWLLVLGITGVLLDHEEWRWQRQLTVPSHWLSDRVSILVPAGVMRYIAADPADPDRWVGGSERGLWSSDDRGAHWQPVPFDGGDTPQVLAFVRPPEGGPGGTFIGTDDGIWRLSAAPFRATRFALDGHYVSSLTQGASATELVGVEHHGRLFRLETTAPETVFWTEVDTVVVENLTETEDLFRFVLDLHVGEGLFSVPVSTFINDLGGLALIVLALSGVLYWWLPRRWKKRRTGPAPARRRDVLKWLYRSHAPVIGLLGLLPVFYLAATGIPLNHVYGFLGWAREVELPRTALPPVWQATTLDGEIGGIVAYPGEHGRLSVSSRFGVLHTTDGGDTWRADDTLRNGGGNLFRAGGTLFFSNNAREHYYRGPGMSEWQPFSGPRTAVSDALQLGDTWHLKNSKAIYTGRLQDELTASTIGFPQLDGVPLYLFFVDIHTGNIIHPQFKWASDLFALLALVLVITGPFLWWREKWR